MSNPTLEAHCAALAEAPPRVQGDEMIRILRELDSLGFPQPDCMEYDEIAQRSNIFYAEPLRALNRLVGVQSHEVRMFCISLTHGAMVEVVSIDAPANERKRVKGISVNQLLQSLPRLAEPLRKLKPKAPEDPGYGPDGGVVSIG